MLNDAVTGRATNLEIAGFPAGDALHLSSAEIGRVDVLLTTDDRFVSRARRRIGNPRVSVSNPVTWWREIRQ